MEFKIDEESEAFDKWRLYARDLPEFRMFSSKSSARQILLGIEKQLWRRHPFTMSIAVVAALEWGGLLAQVIIPTLKTTTPLPPVVIEIGGALFWVGSAWWLVCYVIRAIVIKELRNKLLKLGIQVCLRCGYDLRGADHDTCPECGKASQHSA